MRSAGTSYIYINECGLFFCNIVPKIASDNEVGFIMCVRALSTEIVYRV